MVHLNELSIKKQTIPSSPAAPVSFQPSQVGQSSGCKWHPGHWPHRHMWSVLVSSFHLCKTHKQTSQKSYFVCSDHHVRIWIWSKVSAHMVSYLLEVNFWSCILNFKFYLEKSSDFSLCVTYPILFWMR
jgi:hypothetical protein